MKKLLTVPLRHVWSHLFLYFFLAVQVIFLVWIIAGVHGAPSIPAHCLDSHGDVDITRGDDCAAAAGGQIGTGIGAGLVFGFWVGVDIILGIGRMIVVFTRRKPASSKEK